MPQTLILTASRSHLHFMGRESETNHSPGRGSWLQADTNCKWPWGLDPSLFVCRLRRFRWGDSHVFPAFQLWNSTPLGLIFIPPWSLLPFVKDLFEMNFLFSQMGLALRLLSLALRINRQNGGPPATETSDGFVSDLPFALDQRVP